MGNFNKVYIRLLLLFENAQKFNSEAISLTENLTKPHPHRPCIQVKKLPLDLSWHPLRWKIQV